MDFGFLVMEAGVEKGKIKREKKRNSETPHPSRVMRNSATAYQFDFCAIAIQVWRHLN
jgi:hypothetical protein